MRASSRLQEPSARYRFGQGTLTETRLNQRDAPMAFSEIAIDATNGRSTSLASPGPGGAGPVWWQTFSEENKFPGSDLHLRGRDPPQRIDAIDVVRGLALFGVLAINLVTEFRVSIFAQFLPKTGTLPPLDAAVETVLSFALNSKAFALFSLLFGIGLAIQFDRLGRNARRTVLLVRRLAVLLAIGLAHLFLVWNGDILTEHALAGFVVLPFLFGSRHLLAVATLLCLGLYLTMQPPPALSLPDADWMRQHVAEADRVYRTGTFLTHSRFRSTRYQQSCRYISSSFRARWRCSCSALSSGAPAFSAAPLHIAIYY